MFVSSFSNPRVKQIRRLIMRKERDQTGCFFVGRTHLVTEAIAMGVNVELLVLAPEVISNRPRLAQQQILEHCSAPRLEVTADIFASLAPMHIHHGVAARLHPVAISPVSARSEKVDIWVRTSTLKYKNGRCLPL